MSNLLSIGRTGLLAAQTGLATTGHNITNASVAGYTRQGVVQSTLPPLNQGVGYIGSGTQVAQIKRYYDDFLNKQLMNAQATQGSTDAYLSQISQIDNMLSDSTIGLSPALQDFFRGVQTANSTPALQSSRESMLSSGETLAARFHEVSGRLQELQDGVNTSVTNTVNGINEYARTIADLNRKIATATMDPLNPPNDLLDQRDQLIRELNIQVKVNVIPSDNNMLTVTFGSGQPLVVGTQALEMAAVQSPTDPGRMVVAYPASGRSTIISDQAFAGGALGGFLDFRRETLDRVQNEIGLVAAGMADSFNDQHRLGQDLNGDPGLDFFKPVKGYVGYDTRNSPNSTGTIDVTISDAKALTGKDYDLTFANGRYTVTRSDGGKVVLTDGNGTPFPEPDTASFDPATVPQPITFDGVTMTLAGAPAEGDHIQLRPTYTAAANFDVAITDYRKIALAAPIATGPGTANTGRGSISVGTVDEEYLGHQLASNVTLTFNKVPDPADPTKTIDVLQGLPADKEITVRDAQGKLLDTYPVGTTEIPYRAGTTIGIGEPEATTPPKLFGASFTISGEPAAGDTFFIGPNTGGVGDNRNGVLLAGLQTKNILNNGTATYQGAYAATVNYVGNKTREKQVGSAASETAVTQALANQQSVSGVNLDEEAADLLRYQQAYQAAGKVMQVAGQLFDTLLQIAQ
ncbi:flagellar hook-associated protein 1 FlgK [Pseudoduganella flava]|uniref:Flagellar hook-associated protein 1 n=1 Tax=Pseudoduganella flava TaxID=871742 RepID=A0A562PST3_9BURK|nr:flagellar hook-associated protein FlgK [Pseudoduganella flava]QGZ39252.1 flagellar hook-associated protein FlgK [Pseudoduganella flava]TWI47448.1 flagellar hook-associated protein 1 FlgK [Pseudoduganella flava]